MKPFVFSQRCSLLCALLVGVGVMPGAAAQSSPGVEIAGSARTSIWSDTRNLDEAGPVPTASLWLRGTGRLDANQAIVADGWAQLADWRGSRSGNGDSEARVRELFYKASLGDVDLRVGRQLIIWGRADGINPTDSIGRRNFTRLTTEDADQREGADAVAVTYFMNTEYSLQTVWLPRFHGDVIPFRTQPMQTVSTIEPARRAQYAVKLDRSGGDVDWSLSYFNGYDRMPDLSIGSVSVAGVHTLLSHNKVQVFGADFSTIFGGEVLRGEIAWSQRDDDDSPAGFFRKRSQLLAIVGGDKNFDGGLNVNLQLFGQWVPDYRNPDQLADPVARSVAIAQAAINNQPRKSQYGITYRFAKSWLNDTWQAELYGVHSITTHGNYVRAQVKHAINDRWRFMVGVERYRGNDDTVFGQLQRNSTAYAELRTVF